MSEPRKINKMRKLFEGGFLTPNTIVPMGARARFVIETAEGDELCLIDVSSPPLPDDEGDVMEWLITFNATPMFRKLMTHKVVAGMTLIKCDKCSKLLGGDEVFTVTNKALLCPFCKSQADLKGGGK
jgi:hypothetical protein